MVRNMDNHNSDTFDGIKYFFEDPRKQNEM